MGKKYMLREVLVKGEESQMKIMKWGRNKKKEISEIVSFGKHTILFLYQFVTNYVIKYDIFF